MSVQFDMTNPNSGSLDELLGNPALARVANELRALKRNSVRLHLAQCNEHELPIGASKIGGRPELPLGMEWPTSRLNVPQPSEGFLRTHPGTVVLPKDGVIALPFLTQINLREVAPYDVDHLLPAVGMLYFFFNERMYISDTGPKTRTMSDPTGYSFAEYDFGTPANWRVVYVEGDVEIDRSLPPDRLDPRYLLTPYSLSFSSEPTLPQVETCFIGEEVDEGEAVILARDEWPIYADLRYEIRPRPIFQMLGHSDDAQPYAMEGGYASVRSLFWPEIPAPPPNWRGPEYQEGRVLLALDELDEMSFGRDGKLFFCIREQDLKNRVFEHVWIAVQ